MFIHCFVYTENYIYICLYIYGLKSVLILPSRHAGKLNFFRVDKKAGNKKSNNYTTCSFIQLNKSQAIGQL